MEKKEAMKILKDFHDKSALFSIRTALDTVIPELKESEDEKIRKALIKLVKKAGEGYENVIDGVSIENAISWLEKQGEQQKEHNICDTCDYNSSCINPCPAKLTEKQGEKTVDKVEPKFEIGEWITIK